MPIKEWDYIFFTKEEMSCKCGCGRLPKDEFMQKLVLIRLDYRKPMTVNSGFRCPTHNAKVSSSGKDGPHTTGLASDIAGWGANAIKLVELAIKHGMTGIGVSQKGPITSRYIHLDCISPGGVYPRPTIWSY